MQALGYATEMIEKTKRQSKENMPWNYVDKTITRTLNEKESVTVSAKKKKGKPTKKASTTTKEVGTKEIAILRQQNLEIGDIDENPIVKFEPRQTYMLRDFLHTNSILNKSMSVLKEQNDYLVKDLSELDGKDKGLALREAANEVRQNAHALAAIVQAKVKFIKEMK